VEKEEDEERERERELKRTKVECAADTTLGKEQREISQKSRTYSGVAPLSLYRVRWTRLFLVVADSKGGLKVFITVRIRRRFI